MQYNHDSNAVTLGLNSMTMNEISLEDRDQSYHSHSGPSNRPANPGYCADSDCNRGEPSTSRQSNMNPYMLNPLPVYESIDGDLHARVRDAGAQFGRNGHGTTE